MCHQMRTYENIYMSRKQLTVNNVWRARKQLTANSVWRAQRSTMYRVARTANNVLCGVNTT